MIRKNEHKFIIYTHSNFLTGEIFYVGMGIKGRDKQKSKRSKRWEGYINKYGFTPEVLLTNLTWTEACSCEKLLIKNIGRKDYNTGPLINMTDGGDGSVGHTGCWKGKKRPYPSPETIEKLRQNSGRHWQGKHLTEEMKQKISKKLTGTKPSESTLVKLRARVPWNKGKKGVQKSTRKGVKQGPWSKEQIAKMIASNTGKKRSDEFKQIISTLHKGKIISLEVRKKISETLKSKKVCQAG